MVKRNARVVLVRDVKNACKRGCAWCVLAWGQFQMVIIMLAHGWLAS